MARDNSPKVRQKKQLERKLERRASYDRILIVSEGSKTEPNYFREIRTTYRLHTANVEVRPSEFGTTPIQVVEYAKNLFENGDRHKNLQPRAFEKVYAVFDRDDHPGYYDALTLVARLNGKLKNNLKQPVQFQAIVSIPSFELWLLLHYEDIKTPLHRSEVMSRLKSYIPSYEKGNAGIFSLTAEHLAIAIQRAERLAVKNNAHTEPEPFTTVGDLVKLLTKLTN